jgi:protein SDA1
MSDHLLGDLVQYRNFKDKTVTAATRSLIQMFREKNPLLLHRKMRGKPTEESYVESGKLKQYGELDSKGYIPGAEVIAAEYLQEESESIKKTGDSDDDDKWIEDSEVEEEEEIDESDEEEEEEKEDNSRRKSRKRKHSDDEDEDEEEWVDVSEEEEEQLDDDAAADEAQEGGEKSTPKLTLEEKEHMASKISTERIFTQDEFKRIRIEQMKKKISDKNFVKNKDKNKVISIETDSEEENQSKKLAFAK